MTDPGPVRRQSDLADVLEMILDKGVVINADIAITVGQTELLGIEIRAAIASFDTAAKYGLEFPSGTDMRRVAEASGQELPEDGGVDLGLSSSSGAQRQIASRPSPSPPVIEDALSQVQAELTSDENESDEDDENS